MAVGTHTIVNQFSVHALARIPCDSVFLNLLPERAILKRPYDSMESVKKTNEFGEIVKTYPDAPIVKDNIPLRIEPVRPRGDIGFKVETQGGEVFATMRIFFCGNEDVRENDIIVSGTREYQILLVEPYYDFDKLHHLECWARRQDHL